MILPRLYAIVDAATAVRFGWSVPDLAQACLAGGARLLQVRAPQASSGEYLGWCEAIGAEAQRMEALLVVNDRPDIAVLTGAAGVHLGQSDIAPRDARSILASDQIVGWSTHSRSQLDASTRLPLDYVAVGPVFGTTTKAPGVDPVGVELVRYAAGLEPARPVVAIGGITLERVPSMVEAGATSVAVVSDLLVTGDPEARVKDYVGVLSDAK